MREKAKTRSADHPSVSPATSSAAIALPHLSHLSTSPSGPFASSFLLPLRPLSSPASIDPDSAEARRNETDLVRPISTARSNFYRRA